MDVAARYVALDLTSSDESECFSSRSQAVLDRRATAPMNEPVIYSAVHMNRAFGAQHSTGSTCFVLRRNVNAQSLFGCSRGL